MCECPSALPLEEQGPVETVDGRGGRARKSEFSVILQSRAGIRARLLEATRKGKCLMDKEDNKTAAQSLAEKSERDEAQGGLS